MDSHVITIKNQNELVYLNEEEFQKFYSFSNHKFLSFNFTRTHINNERIAWNAQNGHVHSRNDNSMDASTVVFTIRHGFIQGRRDGSISFGDEHDTSNSNARHSREITVIKNYKEKIFTGAEDGSLILWTGNNSALLVLQLPSPITCMDIEQDLCVIGCADGLLCLCDVARKRVLKSVPTRSTIFAIVFNEKIIFSGHEDGTIRLWTRDLGMKFIKSVSTKSPVITAMSRVSELLVTGHANGHIEIINWLTGESIRTFAEHACMITQIHFEESLLLSSALDGTIRSRIVHDA